MKKNLFLLAIVIILAIIPLYITKDAEFAGADDKAGTAIAEINPEYKQWFKPILEPASGEIASLLFALQAAAGASVIAYYIGLSKGRHEKAKDIKNEA